MNSIQNKEYLLRNANPWAYKLTVTVKWGARMKVKRFKPLTKQMALEGLKMWLHDTWTIEVEVSKFEHGKVTRKVYTNTPNLADPRINMQPPFWNHWTWHYKGTDRPLWAQEEHRKRKAELAAFEKHPHASKYMLYELPIILKDGTVWKFSNAENRWVRASAYECSPPEPWTNKAI